MSSDGHWGLWAQGLVSRLWKVGIVGTSRWHLGRQPLFPALQLASPTLRARTRPHHSLGPSPPPHGLRSWHILAQSQDHPVAFPHLAGVGPGDRPGLAGRLRECVLIEELDQDHDFIRDTMPLAKRCRLQPRDASKMPESAWKFLFYLGSWSYTSYLLFGTDYPFFRDPPSVFYDWTPGMVVPRDIAAAYLLQGSFYGHSLYATLYMDTWRKDSVVMLVHHVVTLVLIVSSYAFRYHNVGILVVFLHDISDVLLEFTKLNVYFKSRGGSYHRLHALAADLGCLGFCFSWFWFRLYWFPLKVLYATVHCSLRSVPDIPFYFFFNALLLLLTLMNLYWFLYIVAFAAKVLTGQVRELKDLREYDAAEAQDPKPSKAE
ncbi:ceramide synthase 1 isoform X2 [Lemur catta]|nr:ceramide synthase 1 isoform X2 [Lemur catta]